MVGSADLLELQNDDGGWSYHRGSSWTEPTCFALLALSAKGLANSPPALRGVRWVIARQREDGGWAPRDDVPQSTWVTALALLLPGGMVPEPEQRRAAEWVIIQTGRESGLVYRLRLWMLEGRLERESFDGWPWYPETAAWVAPTALSILALRKMEGRLRDLPIKERIDQGRQYLLAHRCRDGGWNHGSTKALGYDTDSYPETTGIALLALNDSKAPETFRAESLAERHLANCQSLRAASWLRLALLARGRRPDAVVPPGHGGTLEVALATLAEAAAAGKNLFLEPHGI